MLKALEEDIVNMLLENGSIEIEYNPYASYYETVKEVIDNEYPNFLWLNTQTKEQALTDNMMWSITLLDENLDVTQGFFARNLEEIFQHIGLGKYEVYAKTISEAVLSVLKGEFSSSHLRYKKIINIDDNEKKHGLKEGECVWSLRNYINTPSSCTLTYGYNLYEVFDKHELSIFFNKTALDQVLPEKEASLPRKKI